MNVFDDLREKLEEKIKVTSLEIIVTGTKDKPYFEIKYKEVDKEYYYIGYGSYDLNNVFAWKEECFEIVNQVEQEYNNRPMDDLVKALYCLSSQDEAGNCFMDRYNRDHFGKTERMNCGNGSPGICCPYYQSEHGVCFEDGTCSEWLKIAAERLSNNGWIPCSSGILPEEYRGVEITIMEDADEVGGKRYYTEYSWLQDGRWIFKKTPYNPVVIAWRYPIPYIPNGEKRYTNADRIRAMTDEELAEAMLRDDKLSDYVPFCRCPGEHDELTKGRKLNQQEICRKCLIDWLQREVDTQ